LNFLCFNLWRQHDLCIHFPLFKFFVTLFQQLLFWILLHFLLWTKQLWNTLVFDLYLLTQHNLCLQWELTLFHWHLFLVTIGQFLLIDDLHVLNTFLPSLIFNLQQNLLVQPFLWRNTHFLFTTSLHCFCPVLHWCETLFFIYISCCTAFFLLKQLFLCLPNLQCTFETLASFLHLFVVLQVHHLLLNDLFGPMLNLQHFLVEQFPVLCTLHTFLNTLLHFLVLLEHLFLINFPFLKDLKQHLLNLHLPDFEVCVLQFFFLKVLGNGDVFF